MRNETDPGVVRRAQRGDEQARGQVAEACGTLFRRALAKRGSAGEEQEDIVLEALDVLLRRLPSFRWEARFETWALAILFRVRQRAHAREALRRERLVLESEMSPDPERDPWEETTAAAGTRADDDPMAMALNQALQEALAGCLGRIAIEMREVWLRHRLWGHAHQEIAEALGLSMGTVGTRIHRVDGKMRKCLETQGFTPEAIGAGR